MHVACVVGARVVRVVLFCHAVVAFVTFVTFVAFVTAVYSIWRGVWFGPPWSMGRRRVHWFLDAGFVAAAVAMVGGADVGRCARCILYVWVCIQLDWTVHGRPHAT